MFQILNFFKFWNILLRVLSKYYYYLMSLIYLLVGMKVVHVHVPSLLSDNRKITQYHIPVWSFFPKIREIIGFVLNEYFIIKIYFWKLKPIYGFKTGEILEVGRSEVMCPLTIFLLNWCIPTFLKLRIIYGTLNRYTSMFKIFFRLYEKIRLLQKK